MPDYRKLAAGRSDIQHRAQALLALVHSPRPCPAAASRSLAKLTKLISDYLHQAEPIVESVVIVEQYGRHHVRALQSLAALEALGDEWCEYVYYWDRAAVAREWPRFVRATAEMLSALPERTSAEVAVLYSLAVHRRLLPPGD